MAIKSDFLSLRTDVTTLKTDVAQIKIDMATKNDIALLRTDMDRRFMEYEFRLITRLSFVAVSCTTIAVTILTWLIKI